MADRRGRSKTRVASRYNPNDPKTWTKAKLRGKLQELGIWTRANYSITDLIQMYQNQNVSRVRNVTGLALPPEQTTVTTESVPTVNILTGQRSQQLVSSEDGAHGTPGYSEQSAVLHRDNDACSSVSSVDTTEDTLQQNKTVKRKSTGSPTATSTATTHTSSSYIRKKRVKGKKARYTDSNEQGLPTVNIREKIYTTVIGEKVKLECVISSTPRITEVSWQRISPEGQTTILDINWTKYTGSTPNDPHLVIDDIKKADEGNYVCTVSNSYGKRESAPTRLKVKGGPPTLNMKPKEVFETEGENAILKCNVIALPEVSEITWSKEEQGDERTIEIDNDKYIGGSRKSPSLVITETEKKYDEGKYSCEAENIVGPGRNSVELKINRKNGKTKTDEPIPTKDIEEQVLYRHAQMVNALSNLICPTEKETWAHFKELVKVYVPNFHYKEDLHHIVTNLRKKGHISCGNYGKLFEIVYEIHKPASHIILKAAADIKTIREGGLPNESTVELKCTFEGSFDPNTSQKYTNQIEEQYPEGNGRTKIKQGQGSIVLNFTISEAKTPHQLSALYLAVTLRTRLQNRQITLKDESNQPLVLKTTPAVTIPSENPKDMHKVRLSKGYYQFIDGKTAVLKCVVVANAETESVQWFKVKEGKCNPIFIDNEKYFGGLPKSPSLAIADVNSSDRGIYFCRTQNSASEVESDFAFVEINSVCDTVTRQEDKSVVREDVSTVMNDDDDDDDDDAKEDTCAVTNINTMEASVVKEEFRTGMEDNIGMKGPPKLIMESQVYTGFGDVAVLKCAVTSNPPEMKVTWTKGVGETEQVIATDNKKYHGGLVKSPSLVIDDVEILDEDVYTCKVENTAGRCSETTYLTVQSKPPSSNLNDGSAMEEDISLMKKDIGAIKKDINTIKQDIAVIRQIGSVVKTVSTTEENTNSNIIDEVRPMDVGAVKVDVTSMKEVVSTVKMELGVDTLTDNRDKVSPIDVSEVKVDSTSVKEDASTVKMELGADTLTDNRAKRTRKIQEMIDTTKLTVRIVLSQSEIITTQALEDAKEVIRNNSMVLIKGAPGDGKTILCYQLLKWLMDGDNENTELSKDPLLLYKMSQWDDFVKPEAQIAVFIDDARGDIVEELERRKDSIQSAFCGKMNSRSNCLIVNVRNDIYNSKQMPSCDLFNVKNIVDLRGKSIMTSKEKLQILEKYVPNIEELSGGKKSEIVKLAPNFGFPQCCRLYRDVPSFQNEGIDFFKKPFDFMKHTLKRLTERCFASLLFLFLNDGCVKKGDLSPSSGQINKKILEIAFHGIELSYEDKIRLLRNCLGEMVGSLVTKTKHDDDDDDDEVGDVGDDDDDDDDDEVVVVDDDDDDDDDDDIYKFCHDSVQDTVALLYGSETKIGFIENCPKRFLRYISTSKNSQDRIVISSSNEHMYKRLLREFESDYFYAESHRWDSRVGKYHSITSFDVWTDVQFLRGFTRWLSGQIVDKNLSHSIKLRLLNEACYFGLEERALCLLSEGVEPDEETPFCVVKGGSVSLLRKLLEYKVTLTARARGSLSSYLARNINVLHEACLCEKEEMVTVLYNIDPHLVHENGDDGQSTLHLVAQTGNCDIFRTVERFILKSLYRVEDEQHKCERVEGGVVHRNCVCVQYMSDLVDRVFGQTVLHVSCKRGHIEMCRYLCDSFPALVTAVNTGGQTVLHMSCEMGHMDICKYLCELFPTLVTAVDGEGLHCLHFIAKNTSDVDMFTVCETHVKQYLESTGRKYDITCILDNRGESVLDKAKKAQSILRKKKNALYDHLVQLFGQEN